MQETPGEGVDLDDAVRGANKQVVDLVSNRSNRDWRD
jgi:hypothetical protein